MSQPYLFYSDRCANSKQVIETLKGLNKSGLYKFISIETLPRNQIPAFLKKVPTLYVPETKDVFVGQEIYGFISKPTNARKELPTKTESIASGGSSSSAPMGELTPWGFEGTNGLTESYSLWDAPGSFASHGGSMYTFLDGGMSSVSSLGMPVGNEPKSENTIKSKTGANVDVTSRLEQMQQQREKEFAVVTKK